MAVRPLGDLDLTTHGAGIDSKSSFREHELLVFAMVW
jgi:hypothetical protein